MSWKDRLKTRQEKQANAGVKPFQLPMGKTVVRILPNPKDVTEPFWHDFGQHWFKGADNKVVAVPLCSYHSYDQDCPYCKVVRETVDYVGDNAHLFDDATVKQITDSKASGKVLVNAAIRAKDGTYEIKILSLAKSAFNAFVSMLDDYGDAIVSPTSGLDVAIERTGVNLNTKYTVIPMPPTKAGSDIDPSWSTSATELSSWVKSQEVDAVKGRLGIEAIVGLAGLSAPKGALIGGSSAEAISKPSLTIIGTDEDEDILEAELEDVTFTEVTNEPELVTEPDLSQSDMDMMSELDELDNL